MLRKIFLVLAILVVFCIEGVAEETTPQAVVQEEVKDGVRQTFYKSGKLAGEVNVKDGKPEGVYKIYYEGGQVSSEINFEDGKIISQISVVLLDSFIEITIAW